MLSQSFNKFSNIFAKSSQSLKNNAKCFQNVCQKFTTIENCSQIIFKSFSRQMMCCKRLAFLMFGGVFFVFGLFGEFGEFRVFGVWRVWWFGVFGCFGVLACWR